VKNIGGTSQYIAFLDESGDHSLSKLDPDFPLFLLALVIIKRSDYVRTVVPSLTDLKLRYWNHEGINLHSRDIRKARGPFALLLDPDVRSDFLMRISDFVSNMPFDLFVTAIRKDQHFLQSGSRAQNPYELALEFTLERVSHFLRAHGDNELPIVAEARGRKEDESLERAFYRIMTTGGRQSLGTDFRQLECPLVFRSKPDNIAGIQLADLCAHPCARHILKPTQPNKAYDIAAQHIYTGEGCRGWKLFP
jgi:hypothetical protein